MATHWNHWHLQGALGPGPPSQQELDWLGLWPGHWGYGSAGLLTGARLGDHQGLWIVSGDRETQERQESHWRVSSLLCSVHAPASSHMASA